MAEFIPDMNNCPMCMVKGPALIPARYAVVTDNISGGIPSWAVNPKTAKSYQPVPGYNYALRAMRQGFIYVFYEKSRQWDAWAVCEDGSLWKQPSGAYAQPKKTPDCTSPKHQATNLEMMILDEMALKGNIWLAFSPSKWMHETLNKYATDVELRQKRMQCVEASEWTVPNQQGVTAASPGSLESILDYKESGMTHPSRQLPYNPAIRRISQTEPKAPWYNFEEHEVKPQGTIYPWSSSRIGGAPRTMQALKNRHEGKNKYGKDITPLVVAIEDPVGIAHELAGFGDDFAALHAAWMDDLSIEFMTQQSLNGAKNQIQQLAKALSEKRTLDAYSSTANYGMDKVSGLTAAVPGMQNERSDALNQLMKKAGNIAKDNGESAYATSWDKYEKELNHEKINAFNTCHGKFCDVIATQLEALAALRVEWLQNEHFIVCTQDFCSTRVTDNLSYREIVDFGIASLNFTDKGSEFLDQLINQYSAASDKNLVWRSIMLNNPDVISETNGLLRMMLVMQGKTNVVASEAEYLNAITSYLSKFTSAYAGAIEQESAGLTGDSSFSRAMLTADRRLSTVGQRIFRVTGAEYVLNNLQMLLHKTIFSVAAGVPLDKIQELCLSDIKSGGEFRTVIANGLQINKSSEDLIKYNLYKENFDNFTRDVNNQKTLSAARINILILFFNGMEFIKQAYECNGNVSSITQVTIAFLGTVSSAEGLVSPLVKHGMQKIKLSNGVKLVGSSAGTLASVLSLGFDGGSILKELFREHKRWTLIGLFSIKVVIDIGMLFKVSGGLLAILRDSEIISGEGVITKLIIRTGAGKICAWAAGWEVMIFISVIEQLYAAFIENELQGWCRGSTFGIEPENQLKSTETISLKSMRDKTYASEQDDFNKTLGALL